jgi:hypothetical protein
MSNEEIEARAQALLETLLEKEEKHLELMQRKSHELILKEVIDEIDEVLFYSSEVEPQFQHLLVTLKRLCSRYDCPINRLNQIADCFNLFFTYNKYTRTMTVTRPGFDSTPLQTEDEKELTISRD